MFEPDYIAIGGLIVLGLLAITAWIYYLYKFIYTIRSYVQKHKDPHAS